MASTKADREPVLPQEGKRNILITSALPYVNNVPHLGNLTGSVLSADVFARYCRARGYQTLYICGSDEYGTATETKALEEGLDPQTLCAKYHAIHKSIYDWFNIDFDIFDRTPTAHQTEIVQAIFRKLWENGFVEERETTQPFCPVESHSSFLADRFIEGECSICHDLGARGDQCDTCGSILDPLKPEDDAATAVKGQTDEMRSTGWLINPHCKVDGATPERRKTKHLYIRLDALREKIIDWFGPAGKDGAWTTNALAITQSWIDKGLQPRAISRDLRWGVPIPKVEGLSDEEYSRKVMYVWFDAPIGYISITKTYTDGDDTSGTKWEQWWKNPENVKLYQFMGKDNVQFHSIVFPASQLGTGEKWTQVHKISATEYLNYENGKFSKSKGIGIFGNNAKDTGIAADIWRFYLLSRRPENGDTEFKWEEFIDTNNNELLKNIGNLVQRTLKFCLAKMDGVVPESDYSSDVIDTFKTQAGELLTSYIEHLEGTRLRAGVMNILSLGALGNKFLQDNKLDNRLLAEEPARCKAVISTAINHIYLLANLIAPYMPDISRSVFEQLGVDPVARIPETWDFSSIPAGHAIGTPKVLFTSIPVSKIEEWRLAYGGEELKRQKALQAEKAAAKKAKQLEAKEKKKMAKLAAAAAAAAPSGEAKQAAAAIPDVGGLSLEKN